MCQRIRAQLQFIDAGLFGFAILGVEYSARARCRPERAALPAGAWIINASVDVFGEEGSRVWHVELEHLAVDKCGNRLAAIGHGQRHILAEPEGVEAVDPDVVRVIRTALVIDPLKLRAGEPVESPTVVALLAGYGRCSGQRRRALRTVEARQMTARQCGPDHALGVEIDAARPPCSRRRLEQLGKSGVGW